MNATLLLSLLATATSFTQTQDVTRVSGRVMYDVPQRCLSPVLSLETLRGATIADARRRTYHIVMDRKGAELAVVMNRENVDVLGAVSGDGRRRWLTVHDYADPRLRAAHELWRRMCCNNCTVSEALASAALPRSLHGARAVSGRYYPMKRSVSAWTRRGDDLWIATDDQLVRIDLERRAIAATYDAAHGLPQSAAYQLFTDGRTLWILHSRGIAALPVDGKRIADMQAPRPGFARLVGNEESVWAVSDTGTHRLGEEAEAAGPPLPTAGQITRLVRNGIWLPDWRRQTGDFIPRARLLGSRIYAESLGSVYEFADGRWTRLARQGRELQVRTGRVWFIGSGGLTAYDPATNDRETFRPPRINDGRYSHFAVTDTAVWVAAEPTDADASGTRAGGIARFDLADRRWRSWKTIGGRPANHVAALRAEGPSVWAITTDGAYRNRHADPGMTFIRRRSFEATESRLHRFREEQGEWDSVRIEVRSPERRLICGHGGSHTAGAVFPQRVRELCVTGTRVFASIDLFARGHFGGYWPSVVQLASRPSPDAAWTGEFRHRPGELSLRGQQPAILNISNSGRRIRPAVGHDEVLAVFNHGETAWTVTDGCVAYFDNTRDGWAAVYAPGYRFYWKATAAFDDGNCLYVGTDRGLIGRLDLQSGESEIVARLKARSIAGLRKNPSGTLVAVSGPAPLGCLPANIGQLPPPIDADAVLLDDGHWRRAVAGDLPPAPPEPGWFFKPVGRQRREQKSRGNFLWRSGPDRPGPEYYVKGVFFPLFLCASQDGSRLWVSTYTGLLRIDSEKTEAGNRNEPK